MSKRIEDAIKMLNEYFVQKILSGAYEILTIDRYTAKVKIDEHIFIIWIANGDSCLYTYNDSFMQLAFTSEEELTVYNHLFHLREEAIKNKEYEDSLKQYKELHKRFGNAEQNQ